MVSFRAACLRLLGCARLWEHFLAEAERQLPLPMYAMAVSSFMETSLRLRTLHLANAAVLR